jgi:zinc transport system permease protein
MELLYQLAADWSRAGYLPAPFEHAFMVRGLVAALIIGPMLGGMGTLVVMKRLSFFTQTLGHAALTGVALGLLLGEPLEGTYAGLYGFCLLVALVTLYLRNRTRGSSDTVVGIVLAQVLGLGIVLLVLVTDRFDVHQIEGVLFGSLITLRDPDLLILGVTAALSFAYLLLRFNRSALVSFNPALASARGSDPVRADYVFVVVLTLVVVASLKVVGALMVLVLVVIPSAAAKNLARSLRDFFWLSVLFGALSAAGGLLVSARVPVPTGGAIVLAASLVFYLTLLLRPLLGRGSPQQGEA